MDAGYFIIAILGCGDGATACTPVATVPTHYSSSAQCEAATGEALIRNSDFDYPTLVARCRQERAPVAASGERHDKMPATALRG